MSPRPCVLPGSVATIISAAIRTLTHALITLILSEVRHRLAVFGIPVLQPIRKLGVMAVALFAAVTECVVAQVEQAPCAAGTVGRRTVRRICAEDGDIARR